MISRFIRHVQRIIHARIIKNPHYGSIKNYYNRGSIHYNLNKAVDLAFNELKIFLDELKILY